MTVFLQLFHFHNFSLQLTSGDFFEMGVALQQIINSGYENKYQSRVNLYQRRDPILFIRDTSNSSSSSGLPGTETEHSTVVITAGICAALFGIIVCWMWYEVSIHSTTTQMLITTPIRYFWKLQRAFVKSTEMRDPSKRLLRLEEIIPAQKFLEWQKQQYTQVMNSVALPSDDYCWLVPLLLQTYLRA